jgi:hypothetical protein
LWRRPRPKLGCGAKERKRRYNVNSRFMIVESQTYACFLSVDELPLIKKRR